MNQKDILENLFYAIKRNESHFKELSSLNANLEFLASELKRANDLKEYELQLKRTESLEEKVNKTSLR